MKFVIKTISDGGGEKPCNGCHKESHAWFPGSDKTIKEWMIDVKTIPALLEIIKEVKHEIIINAPDKLNKYPVIRIYDDYAD